VEERARPTLIVLSEADPVARAVASRWGAAPSTGERVDGASVHRLGPDRYFVRRPGLHLEDDGLERLLPAALAGQSPTLIFASVHRSDSGQRCFTVHPLGNPGPSATLGGRPRVVGPVDPRAMGGVLRELFERGSEVGLPATYEATHHGPALGLPAFFAEVAVAEGARPSAEEIDVLAAALREHRTDPHDRVALAVGGGHYAPRFTDLARVRCWAFGHILSRHALEEIDRPTVEAALAGTLGAEGLLFARAQDRANPALVGIGPELRESDAPRRTANGATGSSLPASGT
jgi:D-tyrosyl-tRNA(Tyr) deacylase